MRGALKNAAKRRFYSEIEGQLAPSGWRRLGKWQPVTAVFARATGGFIVTLGFTEDRHYDARVSVDVMLARHARFALTYREDPRLARADIGKFLTQQERGRLLAREDAAMGLQAWWSGYASETAHHICEAISLSTPVFLNQPGLTELIMASEGQQGHVVRALLLAETPDDGRKRGKDDPPPSWIDAAAKLFPSLPPARRDAAALRLAYDAWLTYCVLPGMETA